MVSTVQVIRPLLPKHKPASVEAPDGPSTLRRFPEAEKLLQDDPRFAKAPERDRYVQRRLYTLLPVLASAVVCLPLHPALLLPKHALTWPSCRHPGLRSEFTACTSMPILRRCSCANSAGSGMARLLMFSASCVQGKALAAVCGGHQTREGRSCSCSKARPRVTCW